jgi:hypothetical protein
MKFKDLLVGESFKIDLRKNWYIKIPQQESAKAIEMESLYLKFFYDEDEVTPVSSITCLLTNKSED